VTDEKVKGRGDMDDMLLWFLLDGFGSISITSSLNPGDDNTSQKFKQYISCVRSLRTEVSIYPSGEVLENGIANGFLKSITSFNFIDFIMKEFRFDVIESQRTLVFFCVFVLRKLSPDIK